MPTPFPGMDPYLESSDLWRSVHTRLLIAIADALMPKVRPHYRVGVEQRTYLTVMAPDELKLVGIPDVLVLDPAQKRTTAPQMGGAAMTAVAPVEVEVPFSEEVTERYLVVRRVSDREVVTVIELLSPSNKLTKMGREQYERKRVQVLGSLTNLVEIDLLRAGKPMPMWRHREAPESDYRVLVSRSWRRPISDAYLFGVRDVIPDFPIPLREGEQEPILPLNQILHDLYDRAGYDLEIDYSQAPEPPLAAEHVVWAGTIVGETGE